MEITDLFDVDCLANKSVFETRAKRKTLHLTFNQPLIFLFTRCLYAHLIEMLVPRKYNTTMPLPLILQRDHAFQFEHVSVTP